MQNDTTSVIIEKLENMERRLSGIETAVTAIAVQDTKIINIQDQVSALWKKYDHTFATDGPISKISSHQASCPRTQIKGLWWAIGILASVFGSTLVVIITR